MRKPWRVLREALEARLGRPVKKACFHEHHTERRWN